MLYLPQRSLPVQKPMLGYRLNTRHPLARGLICAYLFTERNGGLIRNHARPGWFDLGFGDTNATWKLADVGGRTIDFASTGYLVSSMLDDDQFTGPLTISVRAKIRTGGAYQHFIGKCPSNGASFSPFEFGTDNANPQSINFSRATGGINQFRGWTSSGVVSLNGIVDYTVTTPSNLIEFAPEFYYGSVKVGATNSAGINNGIAVGSGVPLRVGRRFDGATQMDGVMYHIYIWKRYLGAGEVYQFTRDPYNMWMGGSDQFVFAGASAVNPHGGVGIEGHGTQIIFMG